jgi:hypothetical protein
MQTVFIHTNDKQMIGALASAHSMKRNSRTPESFDVKLIKLEDYPWYGEYQGRKYLREGRETVWDMDDLQTFTTLRFMPPELVNYQGRAIVVDPDVFAIGDVAELFDRDMRGASVCARFRGGHKGYANYYATSVMLMDCAKLRHWQVRQSFDEMFQMKRDYEIWMRLGYEDPANVGTLEPEWNDFDNLTTATKMLHNTKRRTQPWKKGLPIDYTIRQSLLGFLPPDWTPAGLIKRVRLPGRYHSHPDRAQENLFFALVGECLQNGTITEALLAEHMRKNNVRHDAAEIVRQAPGVDQVLQSLPARAA